MKDYSLQVERIEKAIEQGPFSDELRSLEKYSCPEWYENAKFGIFIHWGVYAVPAFNSEWYAREMYQVGSLAYEHHLKMYGAHKEFGYKDFIPDFKAEKFDASEWAGLFKAAGAKFVVPVAEHHDGFAMYQTELNRWNSMDMGPKRDVIGELANAIRAEDMVFGLSSHRAEHYWFFDHGLGYDSGIDDPDYADLYGPIMKGPSGLHRYQEAHPSKHMLEDWLVRTCELVDKYQPSLVWFDWWVNNLAFRPYLRKFAAYLYNDGVTNNYGAALNYKYDALSPRAAVFDIERGQMNEIYPLFWQNDTAISKSSWGYTENQVYKTSESIVADLIDVVSKNGALLLNVGPRADGTIPQKDQDILREIGSWLKVNGEAIYDTRPWTLYGEGPTKVATGAFSDTHRSDFTSGDIRFTTNGDTLYAMPLARSQDGVVRIFALAKNSNHAPREITNISMLGHGPVEWSQDNDATTVFLPKNGSSMPCALKIT
ncbi:alpha-L-fucosidase [Rubellicoccus peritrichatus]|uniref:alpha-L-fucosidase n=1 Tax=Rubellicoccus peritrichatus TaxID=3080537 RepID=A0AAQ3L9N5_9BACT|nr:alpha-L-fucosidase [Puniceicoccus sp. CR14]WOO41232.1 alpha-L-fucosidase [Puniceicoccus sp. CR14]